jgi:hypothetical protein
MKDFEQYLADLKVYPTMDQLVEATSFAENKTNIFLKNHGILVDEILDGAVYLPSNSAVELKLDAQSVFDLNFISKLEELQDLQPKIVKSCKGKKYIYNIRTKESFEYTGDLTNLPILQNCLPYLSIFEFCKLHFEEDHSVFTSFTESYFYGINI